jgi:hypothetical protein
MSGMIERGAAAILAKVPIGYGMTKTEALEYARAVIEEMREPTPEMIAAGGKMVWGSEIAFKDAWEEAWDAAIAEKG